MKHGLNVMCVLTLVLIAGLVTGCQKTSMQLRQEASEARRDGNYPQAASLFQQSIDRDPSFFAGYYGLGVCQLVMDQPISAQLNLERAWTLAPNDPHWTPLILDALAEAYYDQGPEAQPALFSFLALQAEQYQTSEAFLRQADFLAKAGDADNAHIAYTKAIEFADGDAPGPYMDAARFYLARQDKAKAIEMLRYANYIDPGNDEVYAMFRQAGVVPGPSQVAIPPKDKP